MFALHRIHRVIALALSFVFLTSGLMTGAAQDATPEASPAGGEGSLESIECPFPGDTIPQEFSEGENLACSILTVPQDHEQPDDAALALFVTLLASTGDAPSESPLVVLAGGPGQGASGTLALFGAEVPEPAISWAPFLETHDVILIDQRGTGLSQPSLQCPVDDGTGTPAATPETSVAGGPPTVDVITECAEALTSAGVDLETFTTQQNAADLESLRQALDVETLDLLGTSYGTWLALETMRAYPTSINSAILNSPVPPQTDLFAGLLVGFDQALDEVFDGCAADPACQLANPTLNNQFAAAVAQLNETPLEVSVEDPMTGETFDVPVDGLLFSSLVYQLTFLGPFVPLIPPLVTTAAAGEPDLIAELLPLLFVAGQGISAGMYYSVICQDEIPFVSADDVFATAEELDVRPEILDGGTGVQIASSFETCAALDLDPSDPVVNEAVESDTPVLIVSGRFDPITPPEFGEVLAETLTNATVAESPVAGHDPLTTGGPCPIEIASAFLGDPGTELDISCLGDAAVDFSPDEADGATPEATPES